MESRKILAVIKDALPQPPIQRVEKASIDEVFMDLSAQVHAILLERYPLLDRPPPYDDPTEQLPRPPTTALDWNADALVDLDEAETEDDDPDWDDVVMLLASEIIRYVRGQIFEKLKYTCSAGIARNKMLAKLGSAHKKPNSQTIVRNRACQQFLGNMKFTKIRNLGGKLGDEVVAAFNTDTIKDLLDVSLEQLKKQLGDETGMWLYNTIRGVDTSEVNSRTEIKSMLSAKSFRPSINDFETATRWLRIFVADIYSRLVEEGVLENRRRPKTINLHHRQGAQTRSKQSPIPTGKMITEAGLYDLAKNLLAQVVVDGRAWPCANLSLSVGGFEDGITGNMGIGGFLVRGDEAKAISSRLDLSTETTEALQNGREPASKRRKVDNNRIRTMFQVKQESSSSRPAESHSIDETDPVVSELLPSNQAGSARPQGHISQTASPSNANEPDSQKYSCERCNQRIALVDQSEHEDWHFAKALQDNDHAPEIAKASGHPTGASVLHHGRPADKTSKAGKGPGAADKKQRKLAF